MEELRKFLIVHGMFEKYIRAINDPNCSSMKKFIDCPWRMVTDSMLNWYATATNHGDSTEKDWDKLHDTWYAIAPDGYVNLPRESFLLGLQSKKSRLHNRVKFYK